MAHKYPLRIGVEERVIVVDETQAAGSTHADVYVVEAETESEHLDQYGKDGLVVRRQGDAFEVTSRNRRIRLRFPV